MHPRRTCAPNILLNQVTRPFQPAQQWIPGPTNHSLFPQRASLPSAANSHGPDHQRCSSLLHKSRGDLLRSIVRPESQSQSSLALPMPVRPLSKLITHPHDYTSTNYFPAATCRPPHLDMDSHARMAFESDHDAMEIGVDLVL